MPTKAEAREIIADCARRGPFAMKPGSMYANYQEIMAANGYYDDEPQPGEAGIQEQPSQDVDSLIKAPVVKSRTHIRRHGPYGPRKKGRRRKLAALRLAGKLIRAKRKLPSFNNIAAIAAPMLGTTKGSVVNFMSNNLTQQEKERLKLRRFRETDEDYRNRLGLLILR